MYVPGAAFEPMGCFHYYVSNMCQNVGGRALPASIPEGLALDVDLVILDALWCAFLHTRQNLETSDRLILIHVDDDMMRERHATIGAPEGALLQVEDLIGILVTSRHILVISIGH